MWREGRGGEGRGMGIDRLLIEIEIAINKYNCERKKSDTGWKNNRGREEGKVRLGAKGGKKG